MHTIWLMEHHGTEAQVQEQRKAVAQVLTELGTELLYPIYHEYPDADRMTVFDHLRLMDPPEDPAAQDRLRDIRGLLGEPPT